MRRSRLAVKPNLGPKVGARGASASGGEKKSDDKTKDAPPPKSVEKPKEKHVSKTTPSPVKHVENESTTTLEEPKIAANSASNVNVPVVSSPSAPSPNGPVAGEKDGGQEEEPVKDASVAEVKQTTEDANSKKMDKPAVPRRSRFPKARPNLSDAGRPRTRTPSISMSDNEEETRRHPPTVHRTAPLKVSQGQPIPSNPPPADSSDSSPSEENKTVAPVPVEDAPTEGSNTATPLKPTQEKPVKKVAEDVSSAKKEVKKRYKVNWGDEPPDRTKMTMRDLIHWNPSRNPMKNTDNKKKKVITSPKENILEATEEEQRLDDVDVTGSDQGEADMPVPQVMIGPDGSIIVNDKSLVIESTPERIIEPSEGKVVHEDEMTTTYASFRNRTLTKAWTQKETTKFYTALSAVGTDFSLVHQLFPKRTRREIKVTHDS